MTQEAPEQLSSDPAPPRRRTWPVVLTAAAAVLVLAVGTLVWRAAGSDHPAPATGSDTNLPDGWRWESHADVEVAVPDSWGYAYAPDDQWCTGYNADGTPRRPRTPPLPAQGYVDTSLPGDASTQVLCAGDVPPAALFVVHLSFLDDTEPAPVPQGWSNVTRALGDTHLNLVTDPDHQALADRVLATAHVVSTDQNGCHTTSPIQAARAMRPDPAFDVARLAAVDSIAVCQYELGVGGGPSLVASQLLTGAAAQSELTAIQQASPHSGPNRTRNCDPSYTGERASVLHLNTGRATHELYVRYSGCAGNGIDDGTRVRELTRADCVPLSDERIHLTGGLESVFRRCVADFPSGR